VGVSREMTFVVRSAGSLAGVQAAAQRTVLQTNPDLPLYRMRRYEDVVAQSQIREVATMRTLTAFAGIALVLAIAGSYAMLMFVVVQRSRELALRQAVGATARDLVTMIGREMGTVLVAGMGVGMFGALVVSRLLSRFLFDVSALDPVVVATTLGVVAVAGAGAALIPARRASTIDPMLVLRGE